jgi:1,4-dihydroxy-2-naphthoate octaprenyltransferase
LGAVVAVTRPNFLPLAVVIVVAALAAAFYAHSSFNALNAVLVLIGAVLLHASVNAYNNYFDYRSTIDQKTIKTPFSGGIDLLVTGKVKPRTTFAVASACLLGAAMIGSYFLERFFTLLLPLMIYGAIAIVAYSPVLARIPAVSEVLAGTGFGLIGLGAYITQTGLVDSTGIAVFVPVSILVALLLFLNEFPDTAIDREAGRRHLVILLGKKRASWVYVVGLVATYASIIVSVLVAAAPTTVLIAVVTFPLAFKASRITLRNYDNSSRLVPALGTNVIVILTTILLLAVGFGAGALLRGVI